ncbi:MAG: peptide chain release factor 1 [bacterium]|nr:peptide chain release factor 1 [bacterium]
MIDTAPLKEEYQKLLQELTNPELISNWEKFQELSKRRAFLEKILKKMEDLEELKERMEENKDILITEGDQELSSLAQEELIALQNQIQSLEKEIEEVTTRQEQNFPTSLIIEVRPGTGGEEAALFAKDLAEMYQKYAKTKEWKDTILDIALTDMGGIKSASLLLEGDDVFEKLQYEGGVHRVQRIPETEKAGRVHTSTASIAVLPKPTSSQLQINPADIDIEFYNASGPGGQNVNKRKTAVRLTHKPTGLVVTSQGSRGQQQNRDSAMALLSAKLLEQKESASEESLSGKRKAQIGWAKRAEKIRTYNFPQDRLTDHRIEKSWHGLEKILAGGLDPVVNALEEYQKSQTKEPA